MIFIKKEEAPHTLHHARMMDGVRIHHALHSEPTNRHHFLLSFVVGAHKDIRIRAKFMHTQ